MQSLWVKSTIPLSMNTDQPQPSIALVNETFPSDCISYKFLVDSTQKQYHVSGAPVSEPQPIARRFLNSASSDVSLELKPPTKAVMAREPQTPSSTSSPDRMGPVTTLPDTRPAQEDVVRETTAPSRQNVLRQPDDALADVIAEARRLQHMVGSRQSCLPTLYLRFPAARPG